MTAVPLPSARPPLTEPWSTEVLEFAAQRGVTDYLEPMLDATLRVFPTARRIEVHVERDPEFSSDDGILFLIHIAATAIPDSEVVGAFRAWNRATSDCCPAPLICTFLLRLKRE